MKVDGTNLSMIRGDTEAITVSCTDQDNIKIPFVPGDTVYFTVKLNTGTATKLISKVITVFTEGNAVIDIEPEDTKDLQYKVYKYDIQLVSQLGRVTTLVAPALFSIEPEITFE